MRVEALEAVGRDRNRGTQREHRPHDLGPRVYKRGRYYHADLRPWGGGRSVLRNPNAKGWPRRGDRTEDEDIARRWAWKYVDLHRSGTRRDQLGLPGPGTPIPEAAKKWLDQSEHRVAPSTYGQRRAVTRSLAKRFKGAAVEDVEADDLREWFDELLAGGYAVSTLHTYRAHLASFFRDMADHNPAREFKLPDQPASDARAWTDAELAAIREAAKGRDRLWVEFAINTGGRHLELFAATWEQINEKERTIRFTRQVARYGGKGYRPLKGKRARTAVILPEWWDFHDPDARGLVLDQRSFSVSHDHLQRVLDKAGVNEPGASWHRFRHTYARLFLERSDGAMELLSRSLGHASIATTDSVYGHFRTETAAQLARARIYGDGTLRIVK